MLYTKPEEYTIQILKENVKQVVWLARPLCPCCGRELRNNGIRTRVLLAFDGEGMYKEFYQLTRWRCYQCNQTHMALPADLFFSRRRFHIALCEQIFCHDDEAVWLDERSVASIRRAVRLLINQYAQRHGHGKTMMLTKRSGWLPHMLLGIHTI